MRYINILIVLRAASVWRPACALKYGMPSGEEVAHAGEEEGADDEEGQHGVELAVGTVPHAEEVLDIKGQGEEVRSLGCSIAWVSWLGFAIRVFLLLGFAIHINYSKNNEL